MDHTLFFVKWILNQTCVPQNQNIDYWGADTKRDEGGLIKVKKKLTLKLVLCDLKI